MLLNCFACVLILLTVISNAQCLWFKFKEYKVFNYAATI